MKRILVLCILISTNYTFAQNFERMYAVNYESAARAIKAFDGGYILAGSTTFGVSTSDILIIKTDSNGVMQWSKIFQSVIDDECMWIEPDKDSTYLLCGNSYDNMNGILKMFVIRLGQTGNIINQNIYYGHNAERSACIRLTKDGGSIIAGETISTAGDLQMYLVKLDTAGVVQWSKEYGETDQEYGTYVEQTSDNGFILTGVSRINSYASSICVVKTDSMGNPKWSKKYNTDPVLSKCLSYRIFQTTTGYIVCTSTDNNQSPISYMLMSLDSSGDIIWQKIFRSSNSEYSFDALRDFSGTTVCGTTNNQFVGLDDIMLFNVSDSGSLQWQLGYQIQDSSMSASSVSKLENGKYLIAGVTDASHLNIPHMLMIKTDSIYNQSLCNMYLPSLTTGNSSLIATPFTAFTSDTCVRVTANYTLASGVLEYDKCPNGTVGTEENALNELNIYQAASGNVICDHGNIPPTHVNIYDLQGQLIRTVKLQEKSGSEIILFNNLINGNSAYLFNIINGKQLLTRKLILHQ